MRLKSLEITGFKSFGKKTTLEFSTPISGIVGPNGSGKSNVAEAFRFVLGEQSMKSLRGKRGEDLIFNGGLAASRMNRAAVKLIFDNTDRTLGLDFDDVILERVVHRDSANEYFINGSPSRLKDIVELLSGAHIGASGHHIISQGEADRILNANLKERREMIEDALGLKIYHYKREESERKLEKTAENMKQVESLRKEIAPHLRFLEKQMEKIEKTEKVRQELVERAREYFKRESIYIAVRQVERADEERPLRERERASKQELSAAKAVLEKAATHAAVHGKKDPSTEKLLDFEKQLALVRAEREEAARQAGRLEGEIAAEERVLQREEALARSEAGRTVPFRDVEETLSAVEAHLNEAETVADPSAFKKIAASIKEIVQQFLHRYRNEHSPLKNLSQNVVTSIERLQENKQTLARRITALADAEKELLEHVQELRVTIEKEKDTNRDAEKAVFRIMAEHNELVSKLAGIQAREAVLSATEITFKNDLGEVAALAGRAILDFNHYAFTPHLSDMDIASESREQQENRRKHIERLKIRIEEAGAGGGEEVVKEYTEAKNRDEFLAREIADLDTSAETLRTLIADLAEKLDTEFKAGVTKINEQFGHFFTLMFGGGAAKLEVVKAPTRSRRATTDDDLSDILTDDPSQMDAETDEAEEGIDIAVTLPKKRIKGLAMLSGGERALTSIALLFAVSQVNPPPFIILDETDAALDEANSRKYGDMIQNLSNYSQLILITHNRETMSRAGILYGVTMTAEGSSKLLSIKFDEAVVVAK